jgi:NAD(P)-dependent dehydrogenase (short-subunit alcohol dehydrogenase family)
MPETKTILITGASSGIGEAVALELSKAGHTIVVGARRMDRLQDLVSRIEASGGIARAHRIDVTSRDDFARAVSATLEEFGRIDVIVNNAGVMPLSRLNALKVSEWDQMVGVNIKGVHCGCATCHGSSRLRSHHQCRVHRCTSGLANGCGLFRNEIRSLGDLRRSSARDGSIAGHGDLAWGGHQ